jgi:nucleoside-diphosphate-sugar epimerase
MAQTGSVRRVAVTGSAGKIGSRVVAALEGRGDQVRRFDLVDGEDLREPDVVAEAMVGCDAIVHAGAIPHDDRGTPAEIEATNVGGTRHVLAAADAAGIERIVLFSSVMAFGFWEGEGTPDYLPVDDEHPRRPSRAYGRSKRDSEDLCEAWSERTGRPSIVLRPVRVIDERDMDRLVRSRLEMDGWVHVDDVVDATLAALDRELPRHTRAILSAGGPFDTSVARYVLGWAPARTWPNGPLRSVRRAVIRRASRT